MRILFIGDVIGRPGRDVLAAWGPPGPGRMPLIGIDAAQFGIGAAS